MDWEENVHRCKNSSQTACGLSSGPGRIEKPEVLYYEAKLHSIDKMSRWRPDEGCEHKCGTYEEFNISYGDCKAAICQEGRETLYGSINKIKKCHTVLNTDL